MISATSAKEIPVKRIPAVSRFIHKFLGLALCVCLIWMGITGVLLNHPGLITGWSVPGWLVPPQYHPRHWNRSALKTIVFSQSAPGDVFVAGHMGIWRSRDGGVSFSPFMSGLPRSAWSRKTHCMILHEEDGGVLLAGTEEGLYRSEIRIADWRRVPLPNCHGPIKKILVVDQALWVFSNSAAFVSPSLDGSRPFRQMPMLRDRMDQRVTWIRLFFDLHDGTIWGLPGKLLMDAAGLVLVFLSVSGLYCWVFKKTRRHGNKTSKRKSPKTFRTLYRKHNQLGIWIAAILLISAGTGLFMRPPLLALIAQGDLARGAYPGWLPENPWHEKIHNACFDATSRQLLIDASDGVWQAPWPTNDDSAPIFSPIDLPVPIFVMGATVFSCDPQGHLWVGSFAGLFRISPDRRTATDIIHGGPPASRSATRPSNQMVTSAFVTPDGQTYFATHYGGLRPLDGADLDRFAMPRELADTYRMPLWNFLFELHNGRIFHDLIGEWVVLIIPLGALMTLMLIITGIIDWWHVSRRPSRRKTSSE